MGRFLRRVRPKIRCSLLLYGVFLSSKEVVEFVFISRGQIFVL